MFGKRKAAAGLEGLAGERPAGPGLVEIGGVRDPKSAEPATAGPARAAIVQYLLAAYKDDRGIHVETVLSAAGALAGFAAQMAIRKGMAPASGIPVEKLLINVGGKDGRRYFFGDTLNMIVATQEQGKLSIWRFVAAPMVKAGLPLLGFGADFQGGCVDSRRGDVRHPFDGAGEPASRIAVPRTQAALGIGPTNTREPSDSAAALAAGDRTRRAGSDRDGQSYPSAGRWCARCHGVSDHDVKGRSR